MSEIASASELISSAKRPLIIAGGGVRYSGAEAELHAFATEFGVPVCETSAGKGAMAPDDLLVGGVGVNGTRVANDLAREADQIICVGTRLTDFTTASHSLFQHPEVRFLGINVCAADAYKLGAMPVVADAKLALPALAAAVRERGWAAREDYREAVSSMSREWHSALDADLAPRDGEGMSGGQAYRVINSQTRAGDWIVAAAGSPPGDLLKTFDCPDAVQTHIEFGYSCMGHEIPAGLGIRMADADAGEIFVVIGDGTYLMAPSELATAVQERLKMTVVVLVNDGYQSIHGLQEMSVGLSFGNEFRFRDPTDGTLSGGPIAVDFAANAQSFGCAVYEAETENGLERALVQAREEPGPAVIVAQIEPRRALLDGGAWWDLGVPQVAESERTQAAAKEREARRAEQRFYG